MLEEQEGWSTVVPTLLQVFVRCKNNPSLLRLPQIPTWIFACHVCDLFPAALRQQPARMFQVLYTAPLNRRKSSLWDEREFCWTSSALTAQKWCCVNCITLFNRSAPSLWSKSHLLASVTISPSPDVWSWKAMNVTSDTELWLGSSCGIVGEDGLAGRWPVQLFITFIPTGGRGREGHKHYCAIHCNECFSLV